MTKEQIRKNTRQDLMAASATLEMIMRDEQLFDAVCNVLEARYDQAVEAQKQKKKDEALLNKPHKEVLKPV